MSDTTTLNRLAWQLIDATGGDPDGARAAVFHAWHDGRATAPTGEPSTRLAEVRTKAVAYRDAVSEYNHALRRGMRGAELDTLILAAKSAWDALDTFHVALVEDADLLDWLERMLAALDSESKMEIFLAGLGSGVATQFQCEIAPSNGQPWRSYQGIGLRGAIRASRAAHTATPAERCPTCGFRVGEGRGTQYYADERKIDLCRDAWHGAATPPVEEGADG